jgi:uncharacterized protein YbjQ (UPF0145 family)
MGEVQAAQCVERRVGRWALADALQVVVESHVCPDHIAGKLSPQGGAMTIDHAMTTTAFALDGYQVAKTLGVVRGITVRSRSVFGTIGASLQTLVGGNITLLTDLCESTRSDAFELALQHAAKLGANAVIGLRYDATEVMQGVTEVLCYGTAVVVTKEN